MDSSVLRLARPRDSWGSAQERASVLVEALRPAVAFWPLMIVALVASVIRRSIRPAVLAGTCGLLTTAAVALTKIAMARPDPHDAKIHGGSFPSGHTVVLVVASGLTLLLVRVDPPRWVWAVPAVLGGVMGAALVVAGAHWTTDVVGGGLLGAAVLATVSASGLARWSARTVRVSPEPGPRGADAR